MRPASYLRARDPLNAAPKTILSRQGAVELRGGRRIGGRIAYGLLCLVAGYAAVLLADGAGPAERAALLRFWALFAVGVFAVAAPHVLLPDPDLDLLQLLNPSPSGLLRHGLRRWGPVVALLAFPCFLLALFDPGRFEAALPEKALHLAANLLLILGGGLYSFARYAAIGQVSQEWQEGKRGRLLHRLEEETPMQPLGIPDGLIPAVTATGGIFLVGALGMVAEAYAARYAPGWVWGPGLLLLGWAVAKLLRLRPVYDRHFYATNAFYGEIFRSAGGVRAAQREPIPYEAVYWAPRRLKPHVWAILRQLDRRLPLGRLILLGHLLLWMLFLQKAGSAVIAAYLLLFSTLKNATVYLVATEDFAPAAFQVTQQSPVVWAATRFFVNLRWTLPLLLSLLVVAFLDAGFGYGAALAWTGLDLAIAFLSAALVTYLSEGRYRRRYA